MSRGKGTSTSETFFGKVYEVVREVPFGRVTTYGAIAEYLGTRGSARMVGWAMNASHTDLQNVPAHRVVNRNGVLTGKHHFGGPKVMQQLLESEGIRVTDDRIVDFEMYFWTPAELISRKPACRQAGAQRFRNVAMKRKPRHSGS